MTFSATCPEPSWSFRRLRVQLTRLSAVVVPVGLGSGDRRLVLAAATEDGHE